MILQWRDRGSGGTMRHQGRHEPRVDDAIEDHDPRLCNHVWQVRSITHALPGTYVCEVCDQCGSLNIAGPDELAGHHVEVSMATPWRHEGRHFFELAQLWSGEADDPPLHGQ